MHHESIRYIDTVPYSSFGGSGARSVTVGVTPSASSTGVIVAGIGAAT